jgi:aspartyl-tRNA(Asn)/glutamyl-tRNA(Gln) amidotransferase subunit C
MADRLGRADVERVAALAHLALTDEERERFTQQLAQILAYAEQIREVDTSGVPPTSHVLTRHPAFRADEVRPSLPREEALANAPEADPAAGLFKVPRVLAG